MRTFSAVQFFFLGLIVLIAGHLVAQDGPVDEVRNFGADTDLIPESRIADAARILKWQQKLTQAHIVQIKEIQAELQNEVNELEVSLAELNVEMAKSGLTTSLEPESLGQFAQRRFDSMIEIDSLSASVEALEQVMGQLKSETTARDKDTLRTEEEHLSEMLTVLEEEKSQLQKLYENGFVPQAELRSNELKIGDVKLQIDRVRNRAPESQELALLANDLASNMSQLRGRQQALISLDASIAKAEVSVSKAAKLKRRLNFLKGLDEQCNSEIMAIRLRQSESLALLKLCEEALQPSNAK